ASRILDRVVVEEPVGGGARGGRVELVVALGLPATELVHAEDLAHEHAPGDVVANPDQGAREPLAESGIERRARGQDVARDASEREQDADRLLGPRELCPRAVDRAAGA